MATKEDLTRTLAILRNTKTDELIGFRNEAKAELHRLQFSESCLFITRIETTEKIISIINTVLTERENEKEGQIQWTRMI
ncbi:hypothetical protein ES703_65772 [subsurface metagenome]